jgi:hypothetical protein
MTSERDEAVAIADRFLDEPYTDPDGDKCVLARQYQRSQEQIDWLRKNTGTMRRWIALVRTGDLTEREALRQIEIDIDRIAGPAVPTTGSNDG